MSYKAAIFDMDGTILTSDKKITPATAEKLAELSRRGVYVAVSTGRALAELDAYKDAFKAVRYGVILSGGIVYDFAEKKVLSSHPVLEDMIYKLIDAGLAEDAMVHMLTLNKSIASERDIARMAEVGMGIYQSMFDRICVRCDDFKKFVRENPGEVIKVDLYHTSVESLNRTVERVKNYGLNLVFAESSNLEASPAGISKASGLIELCQILNIDVKDCVAIGDAGNDFEILETAGVGVAMGNAIDEVKEIADYVTDDNDHDGVLKAIEKFFSE